MVLFSNFERIWDLFAIMFIDEDYTAYREWFQAYARIRESP